jgi:hypothetical protein
MDLGCGLPAMILLKDEGKAMKVGIGMVSRGQVGLMRVAGLGVSAGALSLPTFLHHGHHDGRSDHDNHADICLKIAYKKEPPEPPASIIW